MKTTFNRLKQDELFSLFRDSSLVYKKTEDTEAIFDHKKNSPIGEKNPVFGIILGLKDVVYKAT